MGGASQGISRTDDEALRSIMINGLVGEAVAIQFKQTVDEIGQISTIEKLVAMKLHEAANAVADIRSARYTG